ncbi:MAG: response regulator transcription factor [Bacteroidetes bacterium]|nr:response regulator transcription factor [Bacteroidota bacterium]MBS1633607.1 response regulator transcription factor [Bacteroidota bacterium]
MESNQKITCLVVDDEPPAIDILSSYISSVSALELVATCNDGLEGLQVLRQQPIDLLFLDIEMPHLLGTDMIRTLKNPPKVIFTTAYRQFALEGFELDAVDYLLKPISFERFLKAVNKVMDTHLRISEPKNSIQELNDYHGGGFINIRADRKNIKVAMDDILYVESLKDYIKVVTKTRNIVTRQSISSIEDILKGNRFIRIHRSFIVSVDKIESFTRDSIEIAKQELPISRMYRHEVEKVLK